MQFLCTDACVNYLIVCPKPQQHAGSVAALLAQPSCSASLSFQSLPLPPPTSRPLRSGTA